eukprot:3500892-Rhodomonas_salina.1
MPRRTNIVSRTNSVRRPHTVVLHQRGLVRLPCSLVGPYPISVPHSSRRRTALCARSQYQQSRSVYRLSQYWGSHWVRGRR